MMRKLISVACVGILIMVLTGCGNNQESERVQSTESDKVESEMEGEGDVMENTIRTIGQVTEAVGNELTIQVADMEKSQMGGMMSGGRSEGVGDEERPEGVGNEERPEGMEGKEVPEGVGNREMPEGLNNGERPEGMTEKGQGGMNGGITSSGEGIDYSDMIELLDDYESFTIPVGATITILGTESTFTQIQEENYVVITQSEDGTVVSVDILG